MADRLTQLIADALTRAAADPGGLPLFAAKADPGLFPATSAAKPAAQRCVADGLLRIARTETKGRQTRELYAATDAGLAFLAAHADPKAVLEDFVRAVEARQGQLDELVAAARRMADGLDGLKAAVAAVLLRVSFARFPSTHVGRVEEALRRGPTDRHPLVATPSGLEDSTRPTGIGGEGAVAVLANGVKPTTHDELAGTVLTHLADWAASAAAGQDCPLPELYRSLTPREHPPTVGEFHDCLRRLHADRLVYLHPWTGPLYALPEPPFALLVGHEVAYYASVR